MTVGKLGRWKTRLALFAMVAGPGIITANVDNDAGGIATYSVAGAKYGYRLLWVLPPTCFLLVLVQEMCSRMGVVTGKGLSGLIRERFGLKASFYLMLALVVTNIGNAIADFAGVAASAEIFGISRYFVVPVGAFLLWRLVLKGTYRSVERIFFAACFLYLTYIVSGFLAKPDWGEVARASFIPSMDFDAASLSMVVGIVGTTIAPWMQFYQQASVVEKGIPLKHYRYARLDTILGAVVVTIVCTFIVICCAATIHGTGGEIATGADAARALQPIAGDYAMILFALGLISASFFGATILPISTATSVCEAMGWETGVDKRVTEAPHYFFIYTVIMALGATVALLTPEGKLITIMLVSQVINGVLLPVVVFFMLRITGDREIMGEHVNGRLFSALAWVGAGVVAAMSLGMVALTIIGA
ncbi:MAG: Nramp family divalent metal transporter [Planctomycetes bacterium]|jgi:NRAMP (natural resistance-associated macrophage protein)-like metal ion transporter|nr:Nramp family divalent metal transporter [Planctomycetota bacterium]